MYMGYFSGQLLIQLTKINTEKVSVHSQNLLSYYKSSLVRDWNQNGSLIANK